MYTYNNICVPNTHALHHRCCVAQLKDTCAMAADNAVIDANLMKLWMCVANALMSATSQPQNGWLELNCISNCG